ncbi:sensor histidine kinase [Terrimonas rubra]|uniref:histidine kinase n=1 Tax=Terrimonas rubra TaxID=1035890 RepID=A0ABW6A882_9BACT
MKLLTKLTLFVTLSKLAIVILFVLLLPLLVSRVAFQYTNYYLQQQKKKVLKVIDRDGLDYYFQGDSSYGSYTMLKEEYISLEPVTQTIADTIQTSQRLVEGDTLTYRVLSHEFEYQGKKYMLEVGKTIATIEQYNRPLQRMALYILGGLIVLTILADLIYTRLLLKPLNVIIRSKLVNQQFPFTKNLQPIKTSTSDFQYLDQSLINLMGKIHEDFERERAFTGNASHELLTPITILQTKMENLMMEDLDDVAQDKLVAMMKTLNRLKRIVNSLLLISRIENDQFALTEQVGIAELMNEVVEELQDRLNAKEIQLTINMEPVAPLQRVNRDLLFQLLFNVINNAIRYNRHAGKISITGTVTNDKYAVRIADTGQGIAPAAIPTLFDRFQRAGQTTGEGYGLGLSIVKAIAHYHDMGLAVEAVEGKGATFTILFNIQ